jgi:hypothetical protein
VAIGGNKVRRPVGVRGGDPMAKSEDQRGLAVYPRSGTQNHTEDEEVGNDALACQKSRVKFDIQ